MNYDTIMRRVRDPAWIYFVTRIVESATPNQDGLNILRKGNSFIFIYCDVSYNMIYLIASAGMLKYRKWCVNG